MIWLAAALIGLVMPIGMFGFLGFMLAIAAVATVLLLRGGRSVRTAAAPLARFAQRRMVAALR